MNQLKEYLSGRLELTEFSPSSAVTGSVSPLTQPSVKTEKLGQIWDDLMLKLWALWGDILDTNDTIYDEAKSSLDELKGMQPEQCKAALGNFKMCYRILEKYQYIDKYTPEPQLKLMLSRMRYLVEELTYLCEQYDPEIPRPPEAPIRTREEWDKKQVQNRKDSRASEQGETPDEGLPGQADVVFNPTQRKISTTATFTPGRTAGKDQAGTNNKTKTTARGKETKGGDKRPAKTPTKKNGASKKTPNGKKLSKKPNKDQKASRSGSPKPKKKLREWEAVESSIILASLVEAADQTEPEAHFLTVGESIRAALEAHTDIAEARCEIGECTPGGLPRLDLFVEWTSGTRPSDCYGYARLWFNEDVGLSVMDACDRVQDVLRLDEDICDDEIACRLYAALDEVYDPSAERVWEESRVVPAIYRLIERAQRGETVHERAYAQVMDCLRGRLGLHESVRVPGTSIRLQTRTALGETGAETQSAGRLDYHYSWAVNTPLTHQDMPNLDPFDGSMADPVPGDERSDLGLTDKEPYISGSAIASGMDAEARAGLDRWPFANWQSKVQAVKEALESVREQAALYPGEYAYQACARRFEGRLQHLYDLPKMEAATHWRTPDLVIDVPAGSLYIESAGKKEKVEKDTTDEDMTAKLATMAHQKESEGPVYEPILNKPGSSLNEVYARSGLELEKQNATYYVVYWHGKTIGRVEKHAGGLWSAHKTPSQPLVFSPDDKGEHLGPHPAAIALAKGQGLTESELSQKALVFLERLDEDEFDHFVEAVDLNLADTRFASTVLFARKLYELDFGGSWTDTFSRQLENPDPTALTEAIVFAVKEEGLSFGAVEWADQHWREFL